MSEHEPAPEPVDQPVDDAESKDQYVWRNGIDWALEDE